MTKLRFETTALDGVLKIYPSTDFRDHRGRYLEIYNNSAFKSIGINTNFIQDNVSISTKGVLRGVHGDEKTWKLVTCLYGTIYLLVVNNLRDSKEFKRWQAFEISEADRFQVLVPPGFGNGHLVLSEFALFHYKQSTNYEPAAQFTIKWDDPNFNFSWPIQNPILSTRDSSNFNP